MIKVTVEMLPYGNRVACRKIGTLEISNVGGDDTVGVYVAEMVEGDTVRRSKIEKFPRHLGVWWLIRNALRSLLVTKLPETKIEITLDSMHHFFIREDERGMVELFGLDIPCPGMGQDPGDEPTETYSFGAYRKDEQIQFEVRRDRQPEEDDRPQTWIVSAEDLLKKCGTRLWCGDDFIVVTRGDYDHLKETK